MPRRSFAFRKASSASGRFRGEQMVLTNTVEDSVRVFQIIQQNTTFSVLFVDSYKSPLAEEQSIKEFETSTETKIEETHDSSSEEEFGIVSTIKMEENGEIRIVCENQDEAKIVSSALGNKQSLKLALCRQAIIENESERSCQLRVRGEEISVDCQDIEVALEIIRACRRGKNLRISYS